ncbi:MAG: SDR family oxidoreductase [Clostridia bacterium]
MKTVLITGGSRGIGKATALFYAKNGYNVAICYNKNKVLADNVLNQILKLGVNAIAFKCDVSNSKQVNCMFNEIINTLGQIECIVNCAGVSYPKVLIDCNDAEVYEQINTNLIGTIFVCREGIKCLLTNGGGSIVNISSIWGITGGSAESVYSASKGGVIAFTKALAKEFANNNINVNCIAPGSIKTDMLASLGKKTIKQIEKETPLGRIGSAEEIAECIYFISNQKFITGQILSPNGGIVI